VLSESSWAQVAISLAGNTRSVAIVQFPEELCHCEEFIFALAKMTTKQSAKRREAAFGSRGDLGIASCFASLAAKGFLRSMTTRHFQRLNCYE